MSQHRVELLRKRADDWKRRERKWHTQLEREFYRSIISRLDDGCEVGLLVAESDEFEKGARAA